MLSPSPTIKLKTWPLIVPVQAITEKPRLESDALANKSARVFPKASKVHESKVLFMS